MRRTSLLVKLAIAFVAVALAGLALVALYVYRTTVGEFSTFMVAHNRGDIVARWAEYYREHGSWQGVELELVAPAPPPDAAGSVTLRQPQASDWIVRSRVAVVDADGRVIIAGQGFELGQAAPRTLVRDGVPIIVDGHVVGRLLLGFSPTDAQTPPDRFLRRFSMALLLGAAPPRCWRWCWAWRWPPRSRARCASCAPPPRPSRAASRCSPSPCAPATSWASWPPRST